MRGETLKLPQDGESGSSVQIENMCYPDKIMAVVSWCDMNFPGQNQGLFNHPSPSVGGWLVCGLSLMSPCLDVHRHEWSMSILIEFWMRPRWSAWGKTGISPMGFSTIFKSGTWGLPVAGQRDCVGFGSLVWNRSRSPVVSHKKVTAKTSVCAVEILLYGQVKQNSWGFSIYQRLAKSCSFLYHGRLIVGMAMALLFYSGT